MSSSISSRPALVPGYWWHWSSVWKEWNLYQELGPYGSAHIGAEGSKAVNEIIRKKKHEETLCATNDCCPGWAQEIVAGESFGDRVKRRLLHVCTHSLDRGAPKSAVAPATNLVSVAPTEGQQSTSSTVSVTDVVSPDPSESSVVKQLIVEQEKLCEQVRETSRLAANLELIEAELEETKAKLAKEQDLKQKALIAASNAHQTMKFSMKENYWSVLVLILIATVCLSLFLHMWDERDICRANLKTGAVTTHQAISEFEPLSKAVDELANQLKSILGKLTDVKKLYA